MRKLPPPSAHAPTKKNLQFTGDVELLDIKGRPLPDVVKQMMWCISHYRLKALMQAKAKMQITFGIKQIVLKPKLWNKFEYWWRTCASEKESYAKINLLTFMDVEVIKGHGMMAEDIEPKFYEVVLAKA